MVKGRLDQKASTATGYAWFVWKKDQSSTEPTILRWIPKCRRVLEREGDYPASTLPSVTDDLMHALPLEVSE